MKLHMKRGRLNCWNKCQSIKLFVLVILSLLLYTLNGYAQNEVITGVVSDTKGNLLSGVSVVIQGTGHGTITDADGKFSLSVKDNSVLEFSFIGMKTEKVELKGRKVINIVMEDDTKLLDEVVVVGYGTQRKKLVTSAVSSLKITDNNNKISSISPSQLLEGRIAGVNMSMGSGNLGTRERVSIRGISSLNAGNEPLYVVDGIPISNSNGNLYDFGESMSTLSTLNLSDIESVEVLKDAASAAIYGSKATNGVVLITTKSGKTGKPDIKLNVNMGFANFANKNKVKYADSKLYLEQYNEGAYNYNKQYGLKVGDSGYILPISNPHPTIPDTDWLGLILQQGRNYGVDASFSGGTKDTKYYVGLSYMDQKGIIKTNALKKITANAKIDQRMNSWLSVGANVTGSFVRNNQVPGPGSGATILARAVQKRPFDLPYKPNGEYYIGGTDDLAYHNPLQILNEETTHTDNYRFLGGFYGTVKLMPGLTFKSSFYADILYTYDYIYYKADHPYGLGTGRIIDNNRFTSNLTFDNVFNYNKAVGDFDIEGLLGHSFQSLDSRSSMIDGNGFSSPAFDVIGVASKIAGINGTLSEFAMESYFGRLTLAYSDKYILNTTIRSDGSSKFVRKSRWGVFPSISLGWNLSNEKFWKNDDFDLKLRISYGKTGNQEGIGNYAALPLISGGLNYDYNVGIGVSSFGNEELTWETADQYNWGLDFSYLNGKINFILDLYQKDTHRLLYAKPMHATTGATSLMSNIGSIRNRGIEITLNTHFDLGKVRWDSQFNIAHNKNKVMSLLDDNIIPIGNNRALKVGEEVGAFYLFKMDGIYQYDGEVPLAQYNEGVRAGDVKWHDVDNNGIINDNDRVIMGNSNPKFSGGWSNTFSYKDFQLDVFANFMYGNDVYAEWKQTSLARVGYLAGTLEEYAENRWIGPGTTNKYARSINGAARSGYNTKNSDRFLEDGSFLRIRTVTLSYNLPSSVVHKLKLNGVRVFCQADNLFLFTPYSGYDPEVSSNLNPLYFGVDNFSMPAPRTISFGLNLKF